MNFISAFIICFLYLYGAVMLYIAFIAKKKGEKAAFVDNITNSLILLISLTINIFFIGYFVLHYRDFIIFPFDLLFFSFILFFLPFFYILIIREKKKMKTKVIKFENISVDKTKELPFKYDIYRKLTHLVVLGIILFYFTLGFLVRNIFVYILQFVPEFVSEIFYSIYNIESDKMIFTQYLVLFLVGISLIGLCTADFIRILKPELYPLKPINQILREKERYHLRLGPQISMAVGCFSVIILFGFFQPIGPLIICISMTMAIFGDIASNLIGRTFGSKYKNIRGTKKTYIGLFAGIIVSYFAGIVILIILSEFYFINYKFFILMPLFGALIIGILDYLDLEIDDNLSFNFVTTTILFFIALIFI